MSDSFGDYLKSIGRIPVLTPAEEVHLGTLVRSWQDHSEPSVALVRRGRRALERMVSANLRLVVAVVMRQNRRIQHLNHDPLDLIQAGNLGLIRAVEKFDPSRGYKFSTYGYWWIRQSINRYLQENSSSIRLPITVIDLVHKARVLQGNHEEQVDSRQIAGQLGQTQRRLRFALDAVQRGQVQSLDQQISASDQELTLLDTVRSHDEPELVDDYCWMHDQLNQLDDLERSILSLRYGGDHCHSFAKISGLTGLSKDQVQRLEKVALNKLRRRLEPQLNP
ncbi:MAG: sigma-70 family RNA polymerase sigma factor [Cyanobacteriota bacterium]|nr:sigma-70 family RNA polymerase sigma factor [Cyanobacteriota bacterium]